MLWLQLQEEVYEEASKHGNVTGVCVPTPPHSVQDLMPGRCYIRYASPDDARKGGAGVWPEEERGSYHLQKSLGQAWTPHISSLR